MRTKWKTEVLKKFLKALWDLSNVTQETHLLIIKYWMEAYLSCSPSVFQLSRLCCLHIIYLTHWNISLDFSFDNSMYCLHTRTRSFSTLFQCLTSFLQQLAYLSSALPWLAFLWRHCLLRVLVLQKDSFPTALWLLLSWMLCIRIVFTSPKNVLCH